MNFVEELRWRGMIHDIMPGTEEQLQKEMTSGYIGFDPTADSLHIGSMVQIMLLMHFQRCGHKPFALVGGATGMVGDPSGKSQERNLLSEDVIRHNADCIKKQLEKFLVFGDQPNAAQMVNNYDWFGKMGFLEFIRDVGKHITVNYMMGKDSVQKRLETGLSFTEFTYQLVQGYDFYHLYKHNGCRLQMGGSDQWGNIVTGTELIRRKDGGEAFALTSPLVTKADGSKFGKTEEGNVWLDPERTSPYKFAQFWLNSSDEDSVRYIRIFTLLPQEEVLALEKAHAAEPHLRLLQNRIAEEVTSLVHSPEAYRLAMQAADILFGKGTNEQLRELSESQLLSVFEGVPQVELPKSEVEAGLDLLEFLTTKTQIFPSKGEARRMLQSGGVSINKEKVEGDVQVNAGHLLNNRYILAQKGKKNYYLVKVV
ncbi:MAG: tyrosine--tRNA ligase [Flavobacteriales bacterium]|nr:tyrosine--tRNA ligase [Flavobacteriales bacterium]MCB9449109.1 tyrosine--tRNA ligase [Flavobacteriales bacterium]